MIHKADLIGLSCPKVEIASSGLKRSKLSKKKKLYFQNKISNQNTTIFGHEIAVQIDKNS